MFARRDRPAFVEGRHAQEDDEDGKGVEQRRLGACHPLLVGKAGPFIADPCGNFATISSMACMASPELLPGAGSPQMFIEEEPLKRSSLGEPYVQRLEVKAEKGTIFPAVLRT